MTAVLGREDAAAGDVALRDRPAPGPTEPAPPAPAGRRLRRTWIVPAAVVVIGALALLPTVGDDGPGPGEAQVAVDGTAEVLRADGDRRTVADDSVRLGPGDTIEVTAGTLRFELADDVRFEGRTAETVGGRAGTTVRMATVPELVAGPLLVIAPDRTEVRAAGSTVAVGPSGSGSAAGAARLDRGLGLGVGSYRGRVALDSAGRRAAMPGLHRIEVATPGTFGRRDLPLRYAADDAWDRRFLGDALALDRQLAPLLTGLEASGPDLATTAGLREALPDLPAAATLRPLVADAGSGGDALVLAALSQLDTGGTFVERWSAAARFHGDGAEWGLVALDRQVAPDRLLDLIREAVDRVAFRFDDPGAGSAGDDGGDGGATLPEGDAAGTTPGATTPTPGPEGAGSGTTVPPTGGGSTDPVAPTVPSGGSGGGSGPGITVPPTPGITVPPPPTLPPSVGGPVGGVVDGVGEIVGGVVDGVEDILGGVVDGVEDVTGGLGVTGSGGLLGPGGLLGGG